MNDIWDGVQLILSVYKDSVSKELLQRFKEEYYLTLNAEAESRRNKMATDIRNMAKLKIELKKFEYTYILLKSKTGDIAAVDNMIKQIKLQIDQIKSKKNRSVRYR